jgi:hypothetical protein
MMLMMVFGGLMMLAMPYITVTNPLRILPSTMELRWHYGRKTWILRCCRKHNRTKQNSQMLFKAATSNLGMSSVFLYEFANLTDGAKNSSISALAGGDDARPAITTATSPQAGLSNNSIKSRGKKRRN